MTINATTAATTTTTAAPTTPSNALTGTKDQFLKLFMAQLQHQDPLNPQNGADMAAQLAQFSVVEQTTLTNQHLADLATAQAATSSAGLANLVGRDCSAGAADFQLDQPGAVPPLQISSTSPMTGASAVITDDNGKELRRIAVPDGTRSTQIAWDGNAASGAPLAPGSYHVTIDPGKTTGTITSQWHGRIDAVELAHGTTQLRMGGVLLSPSVIQTIGQASSPLSIQRLSNPGTTP
jgi:flagellar basal-body rod modification protein FlgD